MSSSEAIGSCSEQRLRGYDKNSSIIPEEIDFGESSNLIYKPFSVS